MQMETSKLLRSHGDISINNKTCQHTQLQVAPFVSKIYQMVNDPRSDAVIRWGRENNSFLVLNPSDFSILLLPLYFKHGNFSSFVRQLNTYGFKKIDPDHWEFAHESFLRCQLHLLPLIVRRNNRKNHENEETGHDTKEAYDEESNEMLFKEVVKLRKEQKLLEEELQGMNRRLQITERSPHQMYSFLVKVAEDPELLPRLILSKKRRIFDEQEKKRTFSGTIGMDNEFPAPLPQSFERDYSLQSVNFGIINDNLAVSKLGLENQVVLLPELGETEMKKVAYPFSLLGHMFL